MRNRYEPQKRTFARTLLFLLAFVYVAVMSHLLIVPKFNVVFMYVLGGINALLLILFFFLLVQPDKPTPR